jgi:hypothetical protein
MAELAKQFSLGASSIISSKEEATLNKTTVLQIKERQFLVRVAESKRTDTRRISVGLLEHGRLKQLRSRQH